MSEKYTIEDYLNDIRQFAVYPKEREMEYLGLGLGSEVGELLGKMKKDLRGDGSVTIEAINGELGDVFWYLVMLCDHFTLDPAEVMWDNVMKLTDRQKREVLKGDGDTR